MDIDSILNKLDEDIKNITNNKYKTWNVFLHAVKHDYILWESEHPVYYHSFEYHLQPMINTIFKRWEWSPIKMLLFVLFHDYHYDPRISNRDNVYNAIKGLETYITPDTYLCKDVTSMILDTLYTSSSINWHSAHISLDVEGLIASTTVEEDEIQVYKEHLDIPFNIYKEKRIEVLTGLSKLLSESTSPFDITKRLDFIRNWNPKIGIFAGSFNPFHIGHYDIYNQARPLFDVVIIANGQNPEKIKTIDPKLSKRLLFNYHVYDGWLCDFVKKFGSNVSIIRGLRNGFDLAYEQNFKQFYYENGGIGDFVYFISNPNVSHISSSAIRSLESQFGADSIKKYLIQ